MNPWHITLGALREQLRLIRRAPSLRCRLGIHRWTAEPCQAEDELGAEWECYCLHCHNDRFDEDWLPTTKFDGLIEAARTPIMTAAWRIQK